MLGADVVVEALHREGITHVFGLPGTTIMNVIDALARRDDVRYLSVRHEQVAAFMADGFARGGGKPAVALASRGPGAANMAIAVHNAHAESIPLIAIVGQVSDDIAHRDAFEEADLVSFFAPICKWAVEIHETDRIPELLQRAVRTAVSGRPGPVVVSIPLDVLNRDVEVEYQSVFRAAPPGPDPTALHSAAERLRNAERPVIIAGGGLLNLQFDAGLAELATVAATPVVTTWMRKNVVDNSAPFFCGSLGFGAADNTEALVRDADLIIALGCRFSEFTTKRYTLIDRSTPLIHVDIDAAELGHIYVPTIGIHADAGITARALARLLKDEDPASEARSSRLRAERAAYSAAVISPLPSDIQTPVPSADIIAALQAVVRREDVILVQDVHTFGPWIQRYVDFDRPGSYFAAAGGSMGWGFPAALGLALARPDERVVAVHGDGSFFMVAQDLETCVRENIPVVNVIVNNFAYGNTRDRQRFAHDGRYKGVFLGNPDFAAYAQLLGAFGERVEKANELEPAIERALASGRPAVIDVIQDCLEGLPADLRPPGTE